MRADHRDRKLKISYLAALTAVRTVPACRYATSLRVRSIRSDGLRHWWACFDPRCLSVSACTPSPRQRNANITGIRAPYAYLATELQQESDSLAIITEIDPFVFTEILGEIGGFWDLILIAWPIFFVALSNEAPNLKARNFRKSAVKAAETVTRVGFPTIMQVLRVSTGKRRAGKTQDGAEGGEQMPQWDRAVAPSTHQQEVQARERFE